jgi:hypothetical protein
VGRPAAGDDRLANLVQWLSMIGSLVGVSLLARAWAQLDARWLPREC